MKELSRGKAPQKMTYPSCSFVLSVLKQASYKGIGQALYVRVCCIVSETQHSHFFNNVYVVGSDVYMTPSLLSSLL